MLINNIKYAKKNSHGGSRHKKMASKSFKEPRQMKMRYAMEGECYARVMKMFGQGNMDVLCNDNVTRLCVIRKKFRGRNKRDNNCTVNTMVLVGLREWEVRATNKKPKVDLLYTYNPEQISDLKAANGFNMKILPESVVNEEEMGGFQIDRTSATHSEILKENEKIAKNEVIAKDENKDIFGDDYNWDDI